MFQCKFCERQLSKSAGLTLHEKACDLNPQKIKGSNQFSHGRTHVVSDETRKKLGDANRRRIWSPEQREKLSKSMRLAAQNNPASYSGSNRGRTKQIIVDGLKLQGRWEVDFYNWCKESNIKVERPQQGFVYQWNGARTYYPDFYLPDLELFIEVKGYEIDRDRAKWAAFPHKLKIIKLAEIKAIRKNCFDLTSLV